MTNQQDLSGIPYHTEAIICPQCGATQIAEVFHTQPWHSYVHVCECGYTIMESEWDTAVSRPYDDPLRAFTSETERLAAAREETQRENAKLRDAIKRLQENTAARNPGRAQ